MGLRVRYQSSAGHPQQQHPRNCQVSQSRKALQVSVISLIAIFTCFYEFIFFFFLLYRLGLCSKAICENSLEATGWNMEKAASGLLDK